VVAVIGMEAVVNVTMEALRTVEPRTRTDEDAAIEPLGAIVTVGRAVVGWDVIVAVRAVGGDPDVDADLSLGGGRRDDEAGCDERSQGKQFQSHFVILGFLDLGCVIFQLRELLVA